MKLKTDAQRQGFLNAFLSKMPRNLGQPRQASHKLNKKQFKSGCGYKEISAMPRGYGMARDKTFASLESGITATPLVGGRTFSRKHSLDRTIPNRKLSFEEQLRLEEAIEKRLKAKK